MEGTSERFSILLLEDTRDDEQLSIRALRTCGLPVDVSVARDGEEALGLLGLGSPGSVSEAKIPDLIISDLKLPKLGGAEVLSRIRKDRFLSYLPFVVLSSSGLESDIDRCLELGASDYWVKPVEYYDYIGCVREIVQYWYRRLRVRSFRRSVAHNRRP
jgi:two-component system response regulator